MDSVEIKPIDSEWIINNEVNQLKTVLVKEISMLRTENDIDYIVNYTVVEKNNNTKSYSVLHNQLFADKEALKAAIDSEEVS